MPNNPEINVPPVEITDDRGPYPWMYKLNPYNYVKEKIEDAVQDKDPYQTQGVADDAEGMPGETRAFGDDAAGEEQDKQFMQQAGRPFATPGGPPRQGVVGGHFLERVGGPPAFNDLNESYEMMRSGQASGARAGAAQANEEAQIRAEEANRLQMQTYLEMQYREKERAAIQARMDDLQKQADELAKAKIDSGRIFRSPAGVLGAIAASFMSFAGDPYAGIRIIDQAVNRDIAIQQHDLQTRKVGLDVKRGLLAEYTSLVKDEQVGRALTEAKMKEIAANKLMEVAARYRSPQILAEAKVKAGMIMHDATVTKMDAIGKLFMDYRMAPEVIKAYYEKLGFASPEQVHGQYGGNPDRPVVNAEPANIGSNGDEWTTSDQSQEYWNQPDVRGDVEEIKGRARPDVVVPTQEIVSERPKPPPAARAIEKVVLSKNKELKNIYEDPSASKAIEDLRDTYVGTPQRPGVFTIEAKGDFAKAQSRFMKELYDGRKEGVAKIAEAHKELASVQTQMTRARDRMAWLKQRLGPRANEVWGKLRGMGFQDRASKIESLAITFGMSGEEARAMQQLDSDMQQLKYATAHMNFGALSKGEREIADSISGYNGDFYSAYNSLNRMSQDVRAKQVNARLVGGPFAEAWWRATQNSVRAPLPRKPVPGKTK